jgi:hypothetical protein
LSNKSNWQGIVKLCNRPSLRTSYIALKPLSAIDFFARLKLPVFDRMNPKYVKLLTTSNSNPFKEKKNFVVVVLLKKS